MGVNIGCRKREGRGTEGVGAEGGTPLQYQLWGYGGALKIYYGLTQWRIFFYYIVEPYSTLDIEVLGYLISFLVIHTH